MTDLAFTRAAELAPLIAHSHNPFTIATPTE
jgi:hypothetical protein